MSDVLLAARLFARAWRYRRKLCPAEIKAVLKHLPRGGVGIDVGSHKGGFAWWMGKAVGREGRVIAIEPQARVSEPTARAFRAARMRQVRIIQAAASDAPGEAEMDIRIGSTHGASLSGIEGPGVERIVVPVVSIDQIVAEHGLPGVHFIKIDTEGHEEAVLRGAANVIQKSRPVLLIEIEARHQTAGAERENGRGLEGADQDPVARVSRTLEAKGYTGWFFPANREATPISTFDAKRHQVYGKGTYSNNFLFVQSG